MNIIKRYRLLLLFFIVLLMLLGCFLALAEVNSPSNEKAAGKIMISVRKEPIRYE